MKKPSPWKHKRSTKKQVMRESWRRFRQETGGLGRIVLFRQGDFDKWLKLADDGDTQARVVMMTIAPATKHMTEVGGLCLCCGKKKFLQDTLAFVLILPRVNVDYWPEGVMATPVCDDCCAIWGEQLFDKAVEIMTDQNLLGETL